MDAIRIAVVDDSIFIRKAMVRILEADARIDVVGVAASGEELIEHLEEWKPDLISLDLSMPGMGGLRTLDEIMARRPTPVIILSSLAHETAPLTIEALHRGAVDFIDKQRYSLVDFQSLSSVLLEKILEIVPAQRTERETEVAPTPTPEPPVAPVPAGDFDLLLIGASTGGPLAIQTLLESLGEEFPAPIVIVQHMPAGFTSAFAERLNAHLPFSVREATDGEPLVPRTAYLAPGGLHISLVRAGAGLAVALTEADDDSLHCPSVDRLFTSAAKVAGPRAVAVLLTGMGRDGSDGLAALADAGAYTLAQDESSSVVFGMPRAAIENGAVREVLALPEIGPRLRQLGRRRFSDPGPQ